MATTPQYDFFVNLDDLAFILQQIKIAEATTTPDGGISGLPEAVGSPLLPYGLRTVDGTWNNLLPGQERLGAADNIFPRLVAGNFLTAEAAPANLFFPGMPAGTTVTSYAQTAPGNVVYDSEPRVISNLIVDQTANNPAAVVAADNRAEIATFPGFENVQISENGTLFIPNQSPDIGLSPPFNSVMTIFGQFFDHGLDLITKGGGTVYVPLQPDDPLYVEGGSTNFMVLSRAANVTDPGPDGITGTSDDIVGHQNTTTPFVDQNQTYTSHPSHQVFLREYTMVDGVPLATGKLLTGAYGEGNWGDVKAQAAEKLGVQLTDQDVFNVPLLATDRYGEFIRGENGFVQFVTLDGLVEANPDDNGGLGTLVPANALRTNHEFLVDIAHTAAPSLVDDDHNPGTAPVRQTADVDVDLNGDGVIDESERLADDGNDLTYDDELLARHFATGDGRGNENIALTAIHSIFHSEHNRLVEEYKDTLLSSTAGGDVTFLNEWLLTPVTTVPTTPEEIAALQWNGERLFQAGRFATEMQYQHLVFEEFARAVSPTIDPFIFSNSPDLNPAILEEFANVVYRFGHSMLTDTIARTDGTTMTDYDINLIEAFLNPPEFNAGGIDEAQAIADIVLGMSTQVGNEIDEFIVEALRNNLLGLPLDLATINMTRARDTGVPTFNDARAEFYALTGDSQYKPYTSWADLAPHLKNPASIINFVAAYGTHQSIVDATTVEDKRAAATVLVMGKFDINNDGDTTDPGETANAADRAAFLNGTGTWNAETSGVNDIDFWVGGLAEAKLEFGGMLGPTFNFVFESQLENLQNGDRFYYLSRTQGLNMLNELEANTFSKLIMRNSDLGDAGTTSHLPSLVFGTPSFVLEMDPANQRTGILGPDGVTMNGDPTRDDPFLNAINPLVMRVVPGTDADGDGAVDYNVLLDLDHDGVNDYDGYLSYAYDGGDHVVLGGTAGRDILLGGRGMDTIWGDAGNDYIDAGDEADQVHGGDGDDIIVDHGTVAGGADFLRGDGGNDVVSGGPGNDILFGGDGQDFVFAGQDFTEVFAGRGDDFVLGGNGSDGLMGNEGSDWIEGGEGFDTLSGENSQLFFNSTIIGHDVLNGNGNDTDFDGESGDDIMIQGPGIQRSNGMYGFDWASHKGDPVGANSDLGIPFFPAQTEFILRDRFDSVEGLSGWEHDDVLTGASLLRGGAAGAGDGVDAPPDSSDLKAGNIGLIDGFAELLGMTDAQVDALPDDFSVIEILDGSGIIIGGGGNDTIRGNLGNDIIDGDAWLNTRIRVTANVSDANTAENEIMSVDSLVEIRDQMLAGEINPGQLHIVREILQSETAATDIDTAVYGGNFEEYAVTNNDDGTVTVAHVTPTAPLADDGTDTLRNIEQLQFLDRLVRLGLAISSNGGGATAAVSIAENTQSVTTVTLSNADPTQLYLFSLEGTDAALFEIDALVGTLSFITAPNFEAAADDGLNNVYDVVVRVTDGVLSDSQALAISVTNADDAATGGVSVASWTTTDTSASLTAANTVADEDAMVSGPVLQWQRLNTTTGLWEDITGATGATVANQSSATERVVVRYTDAFGTHEVVSTETVMIGDGLANTLTGTAGSDILLGLGGNDSLVGGDGNDTLEGNTGSDTLTGGAGADVVEGNAGADTLLAGAADGNDTLRGGGGIDTYSLAATSAAATVNLTTETSTSDATGSDLLNGIENVVGSQGGDTITDGVGANVLTGGAGADTFILTGDDARDTINGAGGSNTVVYSSATANLTVTLTNGAVVGGSGTTAATSDVISNINNFTGGSGNDSITGNNNGNTILGGGGNDTIAGGGGVDVLMGEAGNDRILASAGNDTINGGTGSDTYDLSATTAAATVNLTTGTSSSSQTGSDSLVAIENVVGSQGGDTMTDGSGSNVLTGGGGADTFIMTNDNTRDTIDGAGGSNTVVYSSATAALTVTLTNNAVVGGSGTTAATSDVISNINNFTGGSGNDSITGNNNGNTILGGGGNDTIAGGGGVDVLMGEAGNDRILASAGNDTINGGTGSDTYDLSATTAAATVNLTTGTSSSSQTGSDSLVAIENVVGSQGGDTMTDGSGSNVLTGGGGADTFIMTNDNTRDTIDGAGGSNTVNYSSATANLTVTLNPGAVVGGSGTTAGTSDVITNIDNFTGGSGADNITGNANANLLNGNGGNDTLTGLAGNDTLNGGAGNDTLTGGLGQDISTGGTGIDTFDFNSIAEIPNEAPELRERVMDFTTGTDKLDFNGIDANAALAGDQNFTFSTTSGDGFTANAQLRYHNEATPNVGTGSVMQANVNQTNGLNVTDAQVALIGVTTLQQADVIG